MPVPSQHPTEPGDASFLTPAQGFTRWGFGNGSKTYKLTVVEGDKPGKLDRARLLEQVSSKGDAPWPALSIDSMVITGTITELVWRLTCP